MAVNAVLLYHDEQVQDRLCLDILDINLLNIIFIVWLISVLSNLVSTKLNVNFCHSFEDTNAQILDT